MARCDHCLHSHVCEAEGWLDATNCPHFLSSADVVPREEVEELKRRLEICEYLYQEQINIVEDMSENWEKAKQIAKVEVAREIFAEIEDLYMAEHDDYSVYMSRTDFVELKKTYILEGEK